VVVEHHDHALTDRVPERFTTTLVRRQSGVDWFEHRDGAGALWLNTDGDGESDPAMPARADVRERLLGTDQLRLDGRSVRCRVMLFEATSRPFLGGHPVREWVTRGKRWVAADSALAGRVLRWTDLAPRRATETGEFLRRTIVWRYEGTPSGWVQRFTESRDPRTGAMSRSEQKLVDFRYE
jgi:hypothetical protein